MRSIVLLASAAALLISGGPARAQEGSACERQIAEAESLAAEEQVERAIHAAVTAERLCSRSRGPASLEVALAVEALAAAYRRYEGLRTRFEVRALSRAADMHKARGPAGEADLARVLLAVGVSTAKDRGFQASATAFEGSFTRLERRNDPASAGLAAKARFGHCRSMTELGKPGPAVESCRRAVATLERSPGARDPSLPDALGALSNAQLGAGDAAAAHASAARAIDLHRADPAVDEWALALDQERLARASLAQGRVQTAVAELEAALEPWRLDTNGRTRIGPAVLVGLLAKTYRQLGRTADARRLEEVDFRITGHGQKVKVTGRDSASGGVQEPVCHSNPNDLGVSVPDFAPFARFAPDIDARSHTLVVAGGDGDAMVRCLFRESRFQDGLGALFVERLTPEEFDALRKVGASRVSGSPRYFNLRGQFFVKLIGVDKGYYPVFKRILWIPVPEEPQRSGVSLEKSLAAFRSVLKESDRELGQLGVSITTGANGPWKTLEFGIGDDGKAWSRVIEGMMVGVR
jgi:tetratricopeptide (TPR) repeat protein